MRRLPRTSTPVSSADEPLDAWRMLEATSRTFAIPIRRLPSGLQEAVAGAYLCLRAIDEIEDHPVLASRDKVRLLREVSRILQRSAATGACPPDALVAVFALHSQALPPVTQRLAEWAALVPTPVAPRVWEATAATAERMAAWARAGWTIRGEHDLDQYTFAVAGAVGLLLCDLWAWHDGTQLDRVEAVRFGRGLQAVNILRNRAEDLRRGVDLFPPGWTEPRLRAYAWALLDGAAAYAATLPPGPAAHMIGTPLALAMATLQALARGEPHLTREAVLRLTEATA